MDDSRTGFPEADSILGTGAGQEVVDLQVHILWMCNKRYSSVQNLVSGGTTTAHKAGRTRPKASFLVLGRKLATSLRGRVLSWAHLCLGEVLSTSSSGLDQVVTVDGGGHRHAGQPAADELQHGHLGSGVLHGHAVRPQPQVSAPTVDILVVGVIQVTVHNLLGQSEGSVESGDVKKNRLFLGPYAKRVFWRFFPFWVST